MTVIDELKLKLTDAMDTLKKNSETIEFLNKSLTEAQKFSFRALLSSKQNVSTGSVAAVQTAVTNRQASATNRNVTSVQHTEAAESVLSRSRSRSPYCEGRVTSNSPLRLMQQQKNKSSLLLNSNSFSNVKRQEKECC